MYLLQPAKAAVKVQQTKDAAAEVVFRVYQRRQITSRNAPLSYLIESLSRILGRPVVDRTELTGAYDYTLDWAPDVLQLPSDENAVQSDGSRPSLGAALQDQLGLRLSQQHGPVDILNVNRAQKPNVN